MYIDLTRLKNQKYNSWTQFCNLNFVAWLVMTSATILAVGQYLMIILPAFCTRTLSMKWCPTSMCFDLCRLIGFFDEAIVPWLSSKIKTGSLTPLCHSLSGWDTAPPPPLWTAAATVIYSASHDERATIGCFLGFQEIRGPVLFNLKEYPLILRFWSRFHRIT